LRSVTTVIIGAGHAGLAMSRCLTERAIDHVVLERGAVANSWRTERWDSLRLLTPNWQSRLPGFHCEGDDPDGYRTMPEVVAFIDAYAEAIQCVARIRLRHFRPRRRQGAPDQAYDTDTYTGGAAIRWLRTHAQDLNDQGKPWFLVVSFVSPHDIMYADANQAGKPCRCPR
jgi:cation diffusion facilitator CzcD-associated flavoprotein CzcO